MFSYPVSAPEFNYQTLLKVQFPQFPPLFPTTEIEISPWILLTVLATPSHTSSVSLVNKATCLQTTPGRKGGSCRCSFNPHKPDSWLYQSSQPLVHQLDGKENFPRSMFATPAQSTKLQTSALLVPPARKPKSAPNKGSQEGKQMVLTTPSSPHLLFCPGKPAFQ